MGYSGAVTRSQVADRRNLERRSDVDDPSTVKDLTERRVDPDDGETCTFAELEAKSKKAGFSDQDILAYWFEEMQKVNGQVDLVADESGKPPLQTVDVEGILSPVCSKCHEAMHWTDEALYDSYTCRRCEARHSGARFHCEDHREDYCAPCVPQQQTRTQKRLVMCQEGCEMIFTICPNYWQRNYHCNRCKHSHLAGGARWNCQLHMYNICTKCEPAKDALIKVKNGIKCPKGDHWMSWSKNDNPRRRTYICELCRRCHMNYTTRWHCKEHDVDFCWDCEPGFAQYLKEGTRVKWSRTNTDTWNRTDATEGDAKTHYARIEESIGKVKHIVDDLWASVIFPEGTWDIKRAELLIVNERDDVDGLCKGCGALGIPGYKDPDIDDFFCEVCWDKFLSPPEKASEEKAPDTEDSTAPQKPKIYWDRDVGVRVLPDKPEDAAFIAGTKVRLVNLVDKPEMNGRCGEVVRYNAQAKKYVVRPEGGEKLVMLKPENVAYSAPHQARNWWGNEEVDQVQKHEWKPPPEIKEPELATVDDAPLPKGWKSAREAASGKEYFWPARDRHAVTWDRPTQPPPER